MQKIEKPIFGQIEIINCLQWMFIDDIGGKQLWLLPQYLERESTWNNAQEWCQEKGGELPTYGSLYTISRNFDAINKALIDVYAKPLVEGAYWSASKSCDHYDCVIVVQMSQLIAKSSYVHISRNSNSSLYKSCCILEI